MIFNLAEPKRETAAVLSYTGAMTSAEYTAEGKKYTLYTITGSGTLVVEGKAKNVDIWSCGGGSSGSSTIGGAGAYCAEASALTLSGDYVIAVGAANGNSSISNKGVAILSANGVKKSRNGGTGGGRGTGDGIAKYPFSDSTTFKCHCAGGGGGQSVSHVNMGSPTSTSMGSGGSNGGNGSSSGTSGGNYGGGNGGSASAGPSRDPVAYDGSSAKFYGSGGGGGGYAHDLWNGDASGTAGAGYQGVVYIRVPA